MNSRSETVLLTEEQIDLIAKKAAEYVLDGEKARLMKILNVFTSSPVGAYIEKIKSTLNEGRNPHA